MKKYTRPQMVIEEFETNEYVAACWGVGCAASAANTWESNHNYTNVEHNVSGNCSLSGNQVIYDDNGDGVADRMVEIKTNGLNDLNCKIYADETYTVERDISTVQSSDYIYWTTSASGDRVWHHQGQVNPTVPNHPNRS